MMHPDPVPTSNMCFVEFLEVNLRNCSIIISVSGLGIKTFLSIKKLDFQNSLLFNICATGSFFFLLKINFLKLLNFFFLIFYLSLLINFLW